MVDQKPSNTDDLLGFGEPSSAPETAAPQFLSRRELREAEGRSRGTVAAVSAPAPVLVAASVSAPAPVLVKTSVSAPAPVLVKTSVSAPASRPKPSGKNPFSVLATMGIVGGLFAVAGLPAYALNGPDTSTDAVSNVGAQSVVVSAEAAAVVTTRDGYLATTPEQLAQQSRDALRAAANSAYLASGARGLGDDYPWPYELMDDQGGGLSPLNYYYRECVDFVAWRLNRDAGSYAAPFKWVWSNLTPLGGNGGQWMYNWQAKGWPVSKTPVAGAVAYTGGNHIAYVKAVNADGTVLLEEYNYIPGMYGQRTIPASSVVAFLYPPPA